MEKTTDVTLGTNYEARIKKLNSQIAVLEHEKCEIEYKFLSFAEGNDKGRYIVVRSTYRDLIMMEG